MKPYDTLDARETPAGTAASPAVVAARDGGLADRGFRLTERVLLVLVALMTLAAAAIEVWGVWQARSIDLADILLMFLYTEVIGMIAVFYTGRGSPFVYPIFIAITALARLIVLLALAAVVIVRAGTHSPRH